MPSGRPAARGRCARPVGARCRPRGAGRLRVRRRPEGARLQARRRAAVAGGECCLGVLSVPWWGWAATIAAIAAVLGAELAIGIRRGAHEVRLRDAAVYTAAVIAVS